MISTGSGGVGDNSGVSPSTMPEGEPAPRDGSLPGDALTGLSERAFGFYVHVPFCASRCGYCDFNTYTARELGPGVRQDTYADSVIAEIALARHALRSDGRPVQTVFFGGGTPTLLPAGDLARILRAIDEQFGLADRAEVTTEANPESVDARYLATLRAAGFTRMSFGMQSARQHVLSVLDRQHTPGRPQQCVKEAHAEGFEHVNLDLIYSTPGETDDDWRASLESALAAEPDHVSAYALIVEDGTRLAARIRRGELPMPDDDAAADRYLVAEEIFSRAGLEWYEVSNWAASPASACRHNLLYWTDGDWWGAGPGAHSHVNGVRWWNVKHPAAYAARLSEGASPAHAREQLTEHDRRVERIMLGVRLAAGHPVGDLTELGRAAASRFVADGLLEPRSYHNGRLVLTTRGRLLADAVIRDLVD